MTVHDTKLRDFRTKVHDLVLKKQQKQKKNISYNHFIFSFLSFLTFVLYEGLSISYLLPECQLQLTSRESSYLLSHL